MQWKIQDEKHPSLGVFRNENLSDPFFEFFQQTTKNMFYTWRGCLYIRQNVSIRVQWRVVSWSNKNAYI